MTAILIVLASLIGVTGEARFEEVHQRYLLADGIQWKIRSVVYSEIFEESDTTDMEYLYSPPDTFSLTGEKEKIVGVGDTIWVLSERHRQVHKKNAVGSTMPSDFILNWKSSYDLDRFSMDGSRTIYYLRGRENVKPTDLAMAVDADNRVKSISYTDSSGDLVTLSITGEKLKRPRKIDLFFLDMPNGYDFIDLTE